MHAIFINGSDTPTVIQPASHAWRPLRGAVRWEVRAGYVPYAHVGMLVDSHTPVRTPARPVPQTAWLGSWAEREQARRVGRSSAPLHVPAKLAGWPLGHGVNR